MTTREQDEKIDELRRAENYARQSAQAESMAQIQAETVEYFQSCGYEVRVVQDSITIDGLPKAFLTFDEVSEITSRGAFRQFNLEYRENASPDPFPLLYKKHQPLSDKELLALGVLAQDHTDFPPKDAYRLIRTASLYKHYLDKEREEQREHDLHMEFQLEDARSRVVELATQLKELETQHGIDQARSKWAQEHLALRRVRTAFRNLFTSTLEALDKELLKKVEEPE